MIAKVEIDLNSESRNLSKQDGLFLAVKTSVMEELHPQKETLGKLILIYTI